MDFTPEKSKKIAKWVIGIAAACILLYLAVRNIGIIATALAWIAQLVMPLIVGLVMALIFNVPMRFFESIILKNAKKSAVKKIRRILAFVISLILIFGILVGVIMLAIPELVKAIKLLVESGINLVNKFSSMDAAEIAKMPLGNLFLKIDWDHILEISQDWLKNQSGNIVNTAFITIGSLVGGIFDIFISFVFAIYIIFCKEKLKNQAGRLANAWLPERFSKWAIHAAKVAGVNFRNFISGQSLEAVIIGLLCMLGMWILDIPYVAMVSVLVGVTALIPVVGAFAGAIIGAFMILTESPIKALIFLIFLFVLQQVEGNLIYPKVMGSKVNLSGMWILAAVTVGGGIAGPIGMLLSVPIVSTAYTLVKEATVKREERKNSAEAESENAQEPTDEPDEQIASQTEE